MLIQKEFLDASQYAFSTRLMTENWAIVQFMRVHAKNTPESQQITRKDLKDLILRRHMPLGVFRARELLAIGMLKVTQPQARLDHMTVKPHARDTFARHALIRGACLLAHKNECPILISGAGAWDTAQTMQTPTRRIA